MNQFISQKEVKLFRRSQTTVIINNANDVYGEFCLKPCERGKSKNDSQQLVSPIVKMIQRMQRRFSQMGYIK